MKMTRSELLRGGEDLVSDGESANENISVQILTIKVSQAQQRLQSRIAEYRASKFGNTSYFVLTAQQLQTWRILVAEKVAWSVTKCK